MPYFGRMQPFRSYFMNPLVSTREYLSNGHIRCFRGGMYVVSATLPDIQLDLLQFCVGIFIHTHSRSYGSAYQVPIVLPQGMCARLCLSGHFRGGHP